MYDPQGLALFYLAMLCCIVSVTEDFKYRMFSHIRVWWGVHSILLPYKHVKHIPSFIPQWDNTSGVLLRRQKLFYLNSSKRYSLIVSLLFLNCFNSPKLFEMDAVLLQANNILCHDMDLWEYTFDNIAKHNAFMFSSF